MYLNRRSVLSCSDYLGYNKPSTFFSNSNSNSWFWLSETSKEQKPFSGNRLSVTKILFFAIKHELVEQQATNKGRFKF